MPNYDFLKLSPVDFEELTRDLLQKHLKISLESFKEGKDKGIDLRYSSARKNSLIVQCKRYAEIKSLKASLKNELKKVKKLKPKRYVIATSVNLSVQNKSDIQRIFRGIPIKSKDIIGKKDLNNLIGKYPEIENQHYKLWLDSTTIMKRIFSSGIYNRSEFEKEQIEKELQLYVSNESYKESIEILNNSNVVIICGIPGIGKTTLARMLVYNLLLYDFELVSVSSDISEADQVFDKGKKQVFYYDDFLGTNFLLELMNKNEDKRIIKFIERVRNNKNKKLIFTTREYILNQAKQSLELLSNASIELSKYTIDLQKYTKLIKGKILYNHIYYSKLDPDFVNELLKERKFLTIINHPNYNPRIIKYLTDKEFLKETKAENYFNFFIENLVNPYTIWDFAYRTHISPISRNLLLVLITMGTPVFKEDLYKALSKFYEVNFNSYGVFLNEMEFDSFLRECENSFISIKKTAEKNSIDFQNPSIKDFLIHFLKSNMEVTGHILKGAKYFNQFFHLFSTSEYENKVLLTETMRSEIFKRIKEDIYTLPTSSLIERYDRARLEFYLDYKKIGKVKRLNYFSSLFFNLGEDDINEFIYDQFDKIESENLINECPSINDYISTMTDISVTKEIDVKKYLNRLFSDDVMIFFDDLNEVYKIADYFEKEFLDFLKDKKHNVERIIENIADFEYRALRDSKEIVEDYVYDLNDIEKKYNCDLSYFEEKANDKLFEIEDEMPENKNESVSSLKESFNINVNEEELLVNMFDSLRVGTK